MAVGTRDAAVLAREVVAEELVEAEPPEEAVEDRQGGDRAASGGCVRRRARFHRAVEDRAVRPRVVPLGQSRRAGMFPWWGTYPTVKDICPVAIPAAMIVWRGKTSRGGKIFCFTNEHMP